MTNPNEPKPASPGIIVDSDWKAQAQAEKERLASQEQAKKQASRPDAAGPARSGAVGAPGAPGLDADIEQEDRLPPADFRTLTGSLATQALMYMGGVADPETGRAIVALDYAKHYIDLLGVLDAKTKGNLSAEESTELTEILGELRMRFVQITEAILRSEERRLKQESEARLKGAGMGPAST